MNRAVRLEGIWEVPATVARSPLPEGAEGYKMADISTISNREMRHLLETARGAGSRHAVLLLHSFSLVKARDVRYTRLRPDRIVLARLERMLAWLAASRGRYEVSTLGELAADPGWLEEDQEAPAPVLPLVAAAGRKLVQAANRLYWV